MNTSKNVYTKDNITWKIFKDFLIDITDDNGIVNKPVVINAKNHKLYRWANINLIIKKGDKIFNGKLNVHINAISKKYFEKYINFKYPKHISFKDIGSPYYIKDAKEQTITIVPEGKEKEYIEKSTIVQSKQSREITIAWGLLTIKY